jgi:hypothetical protein
MKLPHTQAFQYSFWVSALIFFSVLPFSFVIAIFLVSISRSSEYFSFIIILSNLLLTVVIVRYYRIYISPTGIRAFSFWGQFYSVDWSSITTVKPLNLLGFKYLLVSSTQSPKTLWVCLNLSDLSRFRGLVSEYVEANHIIARGLEGEFPNYSRLDKALSQIQIAWVASMILGGFSLLRAMRTFSSTNPNDSIVSRFIMVVIFLGLSLGIYKKSRIAAVMLLVLSLINIAFILSYLFLIVLTQQSSINGQMFLVGVIILVLVTVPLTMCFIEGVKGTFAYHRLIQSHDFK